MKNKTYHKKKILVVFTCAFLILTGLIGRLVYLMVFDAEYYQKRAEDLHKRERKIKAARGEIVDRNGVVLATNKTVCTISVIHSQIKEPERVTEILAKELEMDQAEVRKRVEKVSSMEKVKTNVEKEVGDKIREYNLDGVKVDEDYKRYYPYDSLASKVLGFTGGDNQGIIGLEVKYEETLKGSNGTILTTTMQEESNWMRSRKTGSSLWPAKRWRSVWIIIFKNIVSRRLKKSCGKNRRTECRFY